RPLCSERATGRTAQAESSSSLNEYSCSIFFRVSNDGRVETGASSRTGGESGWTECRLRYKTNSSSWRRGSRCEGSTTNILHLQGASSMVTGHGTLTDSAPGCVFSKPEIGA